MEEREPTQKGVRNVGTMCKVTRWKSPLKPHRPVALLLGGSQLAGKSCHYAEHIPKCRLSESDPGMETFSYFEIIKTLG